ncbi:AraC family two component transcriptional regulator [Anaerobacterium chartisolvens]|uniref:Stage 0 sporulation protein A homolog n=1 Tax=Anaerobacterium chartisolvens TaxID=1297424 RepID=A0A369B7Z9_9FIRM|nr:response regulator [Anaerobacterium chartisolvens]RCX17551.1 AraC family two component transcriptional regulator [Anaerobacterium chartisolvens]
MFKVLIVDDEAIIRKGLKNVVNWKQFDCEICGEAADGLKGCEMIKEFLPDIIVTDIKMPEIDGLAMMRQIKELVPDSKVIILTGYRDFEYIQEAIKLGAFDFILKPSKIEELNSVVGRAVKELKFKRDRDEEFSKLKKLFEQNVPVLREKLLYDIIYGINTNETDIDEKMKLFNVNIGRFTLVVVENEIEEENGKKLDQYDKHLYQFGIINTFDEIFADIFNVISISLNNKWFAFILQSDKNLENLTEAINGKCVYLQQIIQNCFGFTVTIAISSEGEGALQLPQKLIECREALEHKFYIGNNSIIFFSDLNSFFICHDYTELESYQKFLLEGIKSGNIKAVKNVLQDILDYINSLGAADKEYLKNFYWNTISLINNVRISVLAADNDKSADRKDISSLYKMIERCDNIKDLNGILEDVSLSIAEKVNSFNNKSMKLVLRKAMDYLREHYNEQITLNEVSGHTYVSTYYISRIFKKELGKNFVDCLNEIRIEKAKELLKDIRYKTYEVAEMVGIPDAHYFSKLFKKYEGLTPTEYKDSIK